MQTLETFVMHEAAKKFQKFAQFSWDSALVRQMRALFDTLRSHLMLPII